MSDTKRFLVWIGVVAWAFFSLVFPVNAQQCSEDQLAANTIVVKKKGTVASGSATPDACTSCPDATNGADVLCEDFEEADDNLCATVTEVLTGGGDAIAGAAHSGTLSCTNKGSKALQVDYVVDPGSNTYSIIDSGSDRAFVYVSFYINIVSEDLANGNFAGVFISSTDNSPQTAGHRNWNIFLYQAAGVLYYYLEYKTVAGTYTNETSTKAISVGTWYKIDVLFDQNTPLLQWWIDGADQGSTADVNNQAARWFGPGAISSAKDETMVFQIDLLKIDDDTVPGACP